MNLSFSLPRSMRSAFSRPTGAGALPAEGLSSAQGEPRPAAANGCSPADLAVWSALLDSTRQAEMGEDK